MFSTLLFASVNAHGNMVWPPTWSYPNGTDAMEPYSNQCGGKQGCMWFTNYTFATETKMAADSPMRTYAYSDPTYMVFGKNPWAYPGSAAVNSPCGTYGGNPEGCPAGANDEGEACYGGGFGHGPDARVAYQAKNSDLGAFEGFDIALVDIVTTQVEAGGTIDVNFNLQANHGGGYAYRLCKTPEDGDMTKLTEECFQAGHLDFASDYSWIQWGADKKDSVYFKATRSSNGTYPAGSVWTRDPIPACGAFDGGVFSEAGNACDNADGMTQFEPPVPGVQGFGGYYAEGFTSITNQHSFGWTVGDVLQIPKNLAPGKYVLSWRWDCEQTSQVWFSCSDLLVTKPKYHPRRPHKRPSHYTPNHGPKPGQAPKYNFA